MLFPVNLNCKTPWDLKDTKEIIKPYLQLLEKKTKVDLKKALVIAEKNGLKKLKKWDIDYEKKRSLGHLKTKKINDENGQIIAKFF